VRFLSEKQTEPYTKYGEGASQEKIVPGTEKSMERPALPGDLLIGAKGVLLLQL
jgi:hypothetical protein